MRRKPMPLVFKGIETIVRHKEGRTLRRVARDGRAVQKLVNAAGEEFQRGVRYECKPQMIAGLRELAAECIALLREMEAK